MNFMISTLWKNWRHPGMGYGVTQLFPNWGSGPKMGRILVFLGSPVGKIECKTLLIFFWLNWLKECTLFVSLVSLNMYINIYVGYMSNEVMRNLKLHSNRKSDNCCVILSWNTYISYTFYFRYCCVNYQPGINVKVMQFLMYFCKFGSQADALTTLFGLEFGNPWCKVT